jgi:hypothetical protein
LSTNNQIIQAIAVNIACTGDGLDDLIVGSPYKIESDGSTLEAGKSYVIFGKHQ